MTFYNPSEKNKSSSEIVIQQVKVCRFSWSKLSLSTVNPLQDIQSNPVYKTMLSNYSSLTNIYTLVIINKLYRTTATKLFFLNSININVLGVYRTEALMRNV